MHGLPDWFGWMLVALTYGPYVLPIVLVVCIGWWLVRRSRQ